MKTTKLGMILSCCGLCLVLAVSPRAHSQISIGNGAASNSTHLIVVNGLAEKNVEPNMLTMNIEIWSRGKSAKEAQASNAKEYEKLQKILNQFKIKKEDIRTENFDTNPDYVWENNKNKIVGYRVVHTLKVTIRQTSQAGEIIDGIGGSSDEKLQHGVNVNSIAWDSDKKSEVELLVLADAVKDARKKAEALAKASDTKIKGIYRISYFTSPSGGPSPYLMAETAALGGARNKAVPATSLSEGEIRVRVNVTAEFEILN